MLLTFCTAKFPNQGSLARTPNHMAARILEGEFDGLSLIGRGLCRGPQIGIKHHFLKAAHRVCLTRLCPILVSGCGQGQGWVRVRVRLRG